MKFGRVPKSDPLGDGLPQTKCKRDGSKNPDSDIEVYLYCWGYQVHLPELPLSGAFSSGEHRFKEGKLGAAKKPSTSILKSVRNLSLHPHLHWAQTWLSKGDRNGHLLYTRLCGPNTWHIWSHLILKTTLWGRYYYYLHLMGKEMEVVVDRRIFPQRCQFSNPCNLWICYLIWQKIQLSD